MLNVTILEETIIQQPSMEISLHKFILYIVFYIKIYSQHLEIQINQTFVNIKPVNKEQPNNHSIHAQPVFCIPAAIPFMVKISVSSSPGP